MQFTVDVTVGRGHPVLFLRWQDGVLHVPDIAARCSYHGNIDKAGLFQLSSLRHVSFAHIRPSNLSHADLYRCFSRDTFSSIGS